MIELVKMGNFITIDPHIVPLFTIKTAWDSIVPKIPTFPPFGLYKLRKTNIWGFSKIFSNGQM